MSNLYKQYFVHTEHEKTRVINSNALIEERLAKVLEQQRREQNGSEHPAEGFAPGIAGMAAEVIEDTNVLEDANEEAKRILEEARQKADELMNQAYADANRLKKEAEEEGYREGARKREEELEQKQAQIEQEYSDRKEKIETDFREKQKNMESDLVDVILEVFNKVFHIQFDNKKHILMYLIDDAILNIEGDRKFRIKVAESNVLFLENHREEILERVGHGIELEFIADSTMDGNDCLIETDSGVFDCSLGTQLENLIKDIRSLCS